MGRTAAIAVLTFLILSPKSGAADRIERTSPLNPRGRIHIAIGLPDTVDTLKTFVEPEGCFSPGFATYGIHFWLYDVEGKRLIAATMDGVESHATLSPEGFLVPRTTLNASGVSLLTELGAVRRSAPSGEPMVLVGARACLTNPGERERRMALYVALRPLGPAGGDVRRLEATEAGDALLVDGHTALVANERPASAGVVATDTIGELAMAGAMPAGRSAESATGDCAGALRYDLTLAPGQSRELGFICPVLAGRRAVGHRWDGKNPWAQLDEARPNPAVGGVLQPDAGVDCYRSIKAGEVIEEANGFWREFFGARAPVVTPDERWNRAFVAIAGHAAMTMNEGAPDVAVINYNVFNRDGVYMANIFQKLGRFDLAERAIDYFLAHPFNGRIYPEADNPGQILWIMGEHWRFTRDRQWLARVYPSARKIAAMIRYYRTTPGPHWVNVASLEFGQALPPEKRQEFVPGRCDGHHPEYTEAFYVAGLRAAALMAEAIGEKDEAREWSARAEALFAKYDERFGDRLPREYGSYCVLWPCRLYPLGESRAFEAFRLIGAQASASWRYFPLATAHQGLLAGNREAAWKTINEHLEHEQMRGWFVLDEGGKSGAGGWRFARTTWNGDVAMPHGWAIAELWLLVRDALLFEDGDRLVLLAGVPEEWFREGVIRVENRPTHFGRCTFEYDRKDASLSIAGEANPPGGFVLRLPDSVKHLTTPDGRRIERLGGGDFVLPAECREVRFAF